MQPNEYITVYIEILIVSFLIAAIIYSKVSRDLGSEGEVYAFRWILRVYMAMMVIDSFTQLHFQDIIHPPVIFVALGTATYMSLLSVLAIVWCLFAELQINPQLTRKKWFRILSVIPGTVVVFMCFASIRTGWFFTYGSGKYVRGPYFFFQNIIAYAYFLFTTCHAFYAAWQETSPVKKRRLRKLYTFIIAPSIGALLQLVIGGFPFVGPSISIAILSVFISVLSDMVNMDSLTGLNNRKSMEQYLRNKLPDAGSENPLYLFMIDADRFKQINDTYGHLEGDRALRLVADALRRSVERCRGFIARFGGDEFVAVMEGDYLENPDAFCGSIIENLDAVREENGLAYTLSVSAGYVKCESPNADVAELLKQADNMMYEIKQKKALTTERK